MLGTVDKSGVIRYQNLDINACRDFLRMMGFTCTLRGWIKDGWVGTLTYFKGEWHASAGRL